MTYSPIYAPIFISVYDRPFHFKRCIDSLLENEHAQHSCLFISSDGAQDEKSLENVNVVRDYINSISGFKKVYAFCPSENTQGSIKKTVMNKVKSSYSAHIRMEDDNVVSPYFLKYMNHCLLRFFDDPSIIGISGFAPPVQQERLTNKSIYLSQFWSSWSAAEWNHKSVPQLLSNMFPYADMLANGLADKVSRVHPRLHLSLKRMDEGTHNAKDQKLTYFMIKYGLYQIRPVHSLVRNTGHDGSGVNCGISSRFDCDPYPSTIDISDGYDDYIPKLDSITYRYFHPQWFTRANVLPRIKKLMAANSQFRLKSS
jgi:hypothetical protein